jgi:hypothetical protein
MNAVAPKIQKHAVGIAVRVDGFDWEKVTADLNAGGCAMLQGILQPGEADAIAQRFIRKSRAFEARSSWQGTASAAGNTNISPIRCLF